LTIVKSVKSFRKNYFVSVSLSLDFIFGFRRRQSLSKREKKFRRQNETKTKNLLKNENRRFYLKRRRFLSIIEILLQI
jgi:hypothetical protein